MKWAYSEPATADVGLGRLVAGGGDLAAELVVGVGDELGEQLVAIGEVAIERRRRHAHDPRDVGEPHVGRVLLTHQVERGRLDLLDRGGAGPLAAGGQGLSGLGGRHRDSFRDSDHGCVKHRYISYWA